MSKNKISRLSLSGVPLALAGLTALVAAGIIGAVGYQMGSLQQSRVDADRSHNDAVIANRVSSLYQSTRDMAIGALSKNDLEAIYANSLTPELAATLKQAGPNSIFCSDQTPVEITFDAPASESGKNTLQAHLNFSVRPSSLSAEKHALVAFDRVSTKVTAITCL